jgi:hypothetical protein
MEELKPCPFCGHELDITDGDSLYPNGMGWKDEGEYRSYHRGIEVPKEQWCYAAGCSELSGGCGAEVSGDNRQEAIDKWNARALPDTHRIVSVELLQATMTGAYPFETKLCEKIRAIIDKEPTT